MPEKAVIKCSCKWTKCKRYGKCEECISHHNNNPKQPLPFCKKKRQSKTNDK